MPVAVPFKLVTTTQSNLSSHEVKSTKSQAAWSNNNNKARDRPVFVDTPPPTPNDNRKAANKSKKNITILIDSNRKNIDFFELFPDANVEVQHCGNIPSAHLAVKRGFKTAPDDVVLHIGTNDTEISEPDAVARNMSRLAKITADKYSCKVHLSKLLVRSDEFSENIHKTNSMLESTMLTPGITLVNHNNIKQRHLGDTKHLNRYRVHDDRHTGTQLFSSNLFNSIYNVLPPDDILLKSRRWNRK